MKKIVSCVMLALILISMLTLALNIQPAKAGWTGTIYIKADGSIYPPTAPIRQDGDIYIFIDNIYDEIVVQKNSVVVDGAGYTLQGPGTLEPPHKNGFSLVGVNNVTIKRTTIKGWARGVSFADSFGNKLLGNEIIGNYRGIYGERSSSNYIFGN